MSPWLPWFYQYGVGGTLFVVTLTIAVRSGALDLKRRHDRKLTAFMATALVGFAALHAIWICLVTR